MVEKEQGLNFRFIDELNKQLEDAISRRITAGVQDPRRDQSQE